MSDWIYDSIFSQNDGSVKKQYLITYRVKEGVLMKETVTRNFYGKDDYQDSISHEVITRGVKE